MMNPEKRFEEYTMREQIVEEELEQISLQLGENGGATASTPDSPENNTGIGGVLVEAVLSGDVRPDIDCPSG